MSHLRDAELARKYAEVSPTTAVGSLLGDLSCHIRALSDALGRQGRWIPVTEAMPVVRNRSDSPLPRSADVLVLIQGQRMVGCYVPHLRCVSATGVVDIGDFWVVAGLHYVIPDEVTHWQPLPLLPEDDADKNVC